MILVSGASGLLGANLAIHARTRGIDVVAIFHRHRLALPGGNALEADLTDRRLVNHLLQTWRPNWVVHCAAQTNVEWCEEHPARAYRVNVEMSRNLAVATRRIGAGLVYISTDSVFDGARGHYAEEDAPSPVNVYARSKLAGEQAVQEEMECSLIVRTNIYGWNMQTKQSLAEWILARLESGQAVPGFRDVVFTPILVNDLSEIVLEMMERRLVGVYHVAGAQACSKYEFALRAADIFDLDSRLIEPVSMRESGLKAPRPRDTSLQTDKAARALERPMPDVNSGLRRFKALRDTGFVTQLRALAGRRMQCQRFTLAGDGLAMGSRPISSPT